ncbi:MAG: ATP-binding protein [Salinivirgaceae bacterium]|nr:ATP-binding protein [Salinivirgaceae bacterium]
MKDFSEHILDIVQNSIRANANDIGIVVLESKKQNLYQITITDNGKGMDAETLSKVVDPFYTSRTTRKVGLGIPLFKQNAELTGGNMTINSGLGKGTIISAQFILNHLDRLPVGDLVGTYLLLVTANQNINFKITHTTDQGEFNFDTREVKTILGNVPVTEASVRKFLKEMLQENLNEIGAEC